MVLRERESSVQLAGGKVWKKWEKFSGRQLDEGGRRPQRSKFTLVT